MTDHRPPVVSLIDYGSRREITTGAEIRPLSSDAKKGVERDPSQPVVRAMDRGERAWPADRAHAVPEGDLAGATGAVIPLTLPGACGRAVLHPASGATPKDSRARLERHAPPVGLDGSGWESQVRARAQDRAYRATQSLDVVRTSGTKSLRGSEPGESPSRQVTAAHNRTGLVRALPRFVPCVVATCAEVLRSLAARPGEPAYRRRAGWGVGPERAPLGSTGSSPRFLSLGIAALVLSVVIGAPLLDWGWQATGGFVLGLGIAAFFASALWTACGMGDGLDGDRRTDR